MRLSLLLALAATLTACNKDPDLDEDGFPASEDCNDDDASIHPDAEEVCDGVDNNCDAVTDVDATDVVTWYGDADGDGFGGDNLTIDACEAPAGFLEDNSDCDDNDATISPDGLEVCDGADNDCDGLVDDDDDSVDLSTVTDWYPDSDGDGYGVDSLATQSCSAPDANHVLDGGDCDDDDATLNPETVWYADIDGDGYGAADFTTVQCEMPDNHTSAAADCDDLNPNINPDATEVCDGGADNDCDGLVDDADDSLDLTTRSLWYADTDLDGYGDSEDAGAEYCTGPSGTVADNSDCDDGDGTISPAETEVCNDGIDNDCSGDAPECGLSGTLTRADADMSITGAGSSDYFGRYSIEITDIDGDGNDDLLSGAYGADNGGSSSGTAYVFFGPLTGDLSASAADWSADGESSSDYFGRRMAAAGDLDGDGYQEVLVGAYGEDLNGSSSGAAFIYYGNASGLDSEYTATIYGDGSSDYLGHDVNGLGDLDGDGTADFGVGAYGNDDGASGGGAAYMYFGVPSGLMSTDDADVTVWGPSSSAYVGYQNTMNAGDFDGDGSDDLVLSGYYGGNSYYGAVYVNYGPFVSGTSWEADVSDANFEGGGTYDYLGKWTNAGDLNNDGYDDLVGGEYYGSDSSGSSTGATYVWFGSATPWSGDYSVSDADVVINGQSSSDYIGYSGDVADFNNDGVADLALGAGGADAGGSSSGATYVFYGPMTSGFADNTANADATIDGTSSYEYCGYFSVAFGDVDADGANDLAFGCYGTNSYAGSVEIFLGSGM